MRLTRQEFLAGLALVAVAAACTRRADEPRTSAEGAGVSGSGDPYTPASGDGRYDLTSYVVANRMELDPPRIASGRTTVTASAKQTLGRFHLDFALPVDSVEVNGHAAEFDCEEGGLVVIPASAIPAGATFTVAVVYHSGDRPQGWYVAGDEILATGEPDIARWWFPSNDHPRNAARFDVTLDVPAGKTGVSVGRLTTQSEVGGRSVSRWISAEPMATYLSFFAVGSFDAARDVVDGVEYRYFVSQRLPAAVRRTNMTMLKRMPVYVAALARDFGGYPYADGGGLVTATFDSADFAMENQTRPTFPAMADDVAGRRLIVHELAHHWFGDDVRLARWRDIVLNEAFARWSEFRYLETSERLDADEQLLALYDERGADDPFWQLSLDDPGPDHLLDLPVYDRGGMMVQALRNRVGDAVFFELLRRWIGQFGGRSAELPDFERLAGEVSGQDLSTFFTAWLHERSKPARTAVNGFAG